MQAAQESSDELEFIQVAGKPWQVLARGEWPGSPRPREWVRACCFRCNTPIYLIAGDMESKVMVQQHTIGYCDVEPLWFAEPPPQQWRTGARAVCDLSVPSMVMVCML